MIHIKKRLTDRHRSASVGRQPAASAASMAACLLAAALLLSGCGSGSRPSDTGWAAAIETDGTGQTGAASQSGETGQSAQSGGAVGGAGQTGETGQSSEIGARPAASDAAAPTSYVDVPALSLDAVVQLSRQGDALTWADFDGYAYREIGSGLYIRQYEIDEQFELFIGGYQPDGNPLYIYLKIRGSEADRIDIRTGDVTAFIERHRGSAAASARNG